jgi:DNA polymerase-1
VLVDIERAIRVDVLALAHARRTRVTCLMKEVYEIAGGEFNIGSPKQLSEVLFERLNLPVLKRTERRRLLDGRRSARGARADARTAAVD